MATDPCYSYTDTCCWDRKTTNCTWKRNSGSISSLQRRSKHPLYLDSGYFDTVSSSMHGMKATDCPAALQQQLKLSSRSPAHEKKGGGERASPGAVFFCGLRQCSDPWGTNMLATREQHRGCTTAPMAVVHPPLSSPLPPSRPPGEERGFVGETALRVVARDCEDSKTAVDASPLMLFRHGVPTGRTNLQYMHGGKDGSSPHRFV